MVHIAASMFWLGFLSGACCVVLLAVLFARWTNA